MMINPFFIKVFGGSLTRIFDFITKEEEVLRVYG